MQTTASPVVTEANGSYLAVSPDTDSYRVGVLADTEKDARRAYTVAIRRAREALDASD